jgi:hypothetical protein
MGRVEPDADGHRRVMLKYSYDERIEDGFNAGIGLEHVREWLENPEKL